MKRPADTFTLTLDPRARLLHLRLKAGLTQTALAQKLAGVMLARFRELAESFPPDPRPKR